MAKNTNVKNHKAGDIFEYAFHSDASRPEKEENAGGGLIVIECDGTGANFQTFECSFSKTDTLSILAGMADIFNLSPAEVEFVAHYMRERKGLANNPPKDFADLMGKPRTTEDPEKIEGAIAKLLGSLLGIDLPSKDE